MKVALCLYGLIGYTKKYAEGKLINYKLPYEIYKKNVFDESVSVDVFMHSWSVKYKEELVELYQPKAYQFQEPIEEFNKKFGKKNFNDASHLYTKKRAIEIKKEYEIKNNITYDWVILSRFDICLNKKIYYDRMDNKYFYNVGPKIHHNKNCRCLFCDETNPSHCIHDQVYFSSSDKMDKFSTIFDKINDYGLDYYGKISLHVFAKKHLVNTGLWDNINYYYNQVHNKYVHIWHLLQFIGLVPRSIVKVRIYETDIPLVRWLDQSKFQKFLDFIIFKGKIDILYYYFFGWIHFLIRYFKVFVMLSKIHGIKFILNKALKKIFS